MKKYLIPSIAVLISIVLLPILAYQMGFEISRHAVAWFAGIMGVGFFALFFLGVRDDFRNQ